MRLFISFLIVLFALPLQAQTLGEIKSNLIGVWQMDMDRTWEEFGPMKKYASSKKVKEFEEFHKYYEVYQWTYTEEEMLSISFRKDGRNFPSMNSKVSIVEEPLTGKERSWIEKAPVFNIWAPSDTAIKITSKKSRDFYYIMKCTDKELVVFDGDIVMVFQRTE